MNKRNIILILGVFIFILSSTAAAQSVATADDAFAPFFNPAALSYGNSGGLTFIGYHDNDFKYEDFSLLFNFPNFSFVYGKEDGSDRYLLASSRKLFRNHYIGFNTGWTNSKIKDAQYGVSFLSRPSNMLSMGLYVQDIYRNRRFLDFGVGIKPPGLTDTNRIILTADLRYARNDENSYDITGQKLGIETHLLNGLFLGGNYDLKSETIGFNISVTNKSMKAGNKLTVNNDNKIEGGASFLTFSDKDYPQTPFSSKHTYIQELSVKRQIVEEKEQMKIGPFSVVRDQQTISDLIQTINNLRDDDRIDGIILRNPSFRTNYANLEQLHRSFRGFRDAGKKIVVYSNSYGNLHYAFLASFADEIYLNPNGAVMIQGFSINLPYLQRMFENIGIDIYDLKSHEYKTGLNIFTETEITEYEKETYEALLEVMFERMVYLIETGREDKLTLSAEELINNGPYLSSAKALELGLVDRLIYEDELEALVRQLHPGSRVTKRERNERIATEWSEPSADKVAIIYAVGNIGMGKGVPGRSIGAKSLSEQIRKAREDRSVQGIILRIDSGGGSAYASDVIAREIKRCREDGKPVIASMGGAAASGGYYIAAHSNKIIAENTTITGSIGVTGLVPNFTRMFDKLTINWSRVTKGDNAGLLEPFYPIRDEDLQLVKDGISSLYEQFVDTVTKGRSLDYDEVHRIAQGRVWSGKDALEIDLVDEIGGIDRAVELMKEMIGSKNVELVDYSYSYKELPIRIPAKSMIRTKKLDIPFIGELLDKFSTYISDFEEEQVQYRMRLFDISGIDTDE